MPTPDLVIAGMCEFVRASLASPVTVSKLGLASYAMANIWQYFKFSRPTTTAALKWTDIQCINTSEAGFYLRRLAPVRKNRDAPTRHFTRRILSSEPKPGYIQSRYSALTVIPFVARWSADGCRCRFLYGSCLPKGLLLTT
jgi:hypothetical protein